jgi:hypothetical protein
MSKSSQAIPLNWRAYQPADEREQAIFNQAHQRAHRFMCGVLIGVILFFQVSQDVAAPLVEFGVFIYAILGYLLSEWVGGRVFKGQEVSFKQLRGFNQGSQFWQDLVLLVAFLFLCYLAMGLLGGLII